ncbi:MAG TPA: amino acid--[acyl-carrier-protein] ligase [Steroidobacteraceae bacterium]|nr:amino acid--[acyl-carrier-protein] ligase [Steroidobacteraceae bacterium]
MNAPHTAPSAEPGADPLAHLAPALFSPMGVEGVYARSALYVGVCERLEGYITRMREPQAEVMRFPPVMSRRQLEKSGYLKSFPNLLGCVCALHGSEAAIRAAADRHESGGDWTLALSASDLVLSPAACYPVYPIAAARGPLPPAGWQFDIEADVFRHEPSSSLDRLQSFRMREFVRIGSPSEIIEYRERWLARAPQIAADLALPHRVEVANDPFFGRVGQMMAVSQRQQALKFELLIPYHAAATPTACMSFNYHREHFGSVWNMRDESGAPAHTSCVAFGIDRLVVALFANHGLDLERWPAATRRALGL